MERLPVELLQGIFLLGDHPELPRDPENDTGPLIYPPLLVSRRWREVALSLSMLWTRITLDDWNSSDERGIPVSVLEDWIKRSGEQPLNVSLGWPDWNYVASTYDSRKKRIRILLPHIHHWFSLSCEMDWDPFNNAIFPYLSKACALRELIVHGVEAGPKVTGRLVDQFAPRLKRLDLNSFPYIYKLHRMGGESVNVLNLSDSYLESAELEMLSNEMPNVCELGLDDCSWYEDDELGVIFRNVERFYYACDSTGLFNCIIGGLTRMEHLRVKLSTYESYDTNPAQRILANLPSALQSLHISFTVEGDDLGRSEAMLTIKSRIGYLEKLETCEVEFVR
jgi:hypothetical protein